LVSTAKLHVVVERTAWAAGSALLIAYAAAQWHFARSHEAGLRQFDTVRQQAEAHVKPAAPLTPAAPLSAVSPDMTTWSAGRVSAYRAAVSLSAPEAVLRITSIDLEVPVYPGVTESNLNRGAAWIEGTAALGASGNTGLAAHRDGYFRALRGISVGDRIELQTLLRTRLYTVDDISIVEPEQVQVLAPTADERLTLVTCYPFYIVGPAPKRFVVRARAASARDPS
jgi:sortase A